MSEESENRLLRSKAIHIFSVSAAMVGVCLTVIGIVNLTVRTHSLETVADDLLAFDALLFLTSCFLAYSAMRNRSEELARKREAMADVFMLVALSLMALVCLVIAYSLI